MLKKYEELLKTIKKVKLTEKESNKCVDKYNFNLNNFDSKGNIKKESQK